MKTIAEQAQEAALEHSCSLLREGFRPSAATERGDHYELGYLAAAVRREELIAELVGALQSARGTVAMVHREFNSDRFTDRYGDGEIATQRLEIIDAALAKAEGRSP